MRKIYLCFAAIGSMAIMGGIAACSSDDSTGGGPTTDSGTADTYVPPTDSGAKDSGTKDSGPGACSYCGSFLNGTGDIGNPCTGSLDKALAVVACACNNNPAGGAGEGLCDVDSGTGDGGGACAAFCAAPTSTVPDPSCQGCAADNCAPELGACVADGQDAGTGGDAGDAGDGG